MAQRLLCQILVREAHALTVDLALGARQGVRESHDHDREGDDSERIFDFFRIVGAACRIGSNDRGQPTLLWVLAAQKKPTLSAALCPAAPMRHETFPARCAID
jgi:hypothetical protein